MKNGTGHNARFLRALNSFWFSGTGLLPPPPSEESSSADRVPEEFDLPDCFSCLSSLNLHLPQVSWKSDSLVLMPTEAAFKHRWEDSKSLGRRWRRRRWRRRRGGGGGGGGGEAEAEAEAEGEAEAEANSSTSLELGTDVGAERGRPKPQFIFPRPLHEWVKGSNHFHERVKGSNHFHERKGSSFFFCVWMESSLYTGCPIFLRGNRLPHIPSGQPVAPVVESIIYKSNTC